MWDAKSIIYIDQLSLIMMLLVGFVAISIALFSQRFLQGDRKRGHFYLNLIVLVGAVFVMVCANHIVLLFLAWTVSNLILSRMMQHKREWQAAQNAARYARHNFLFGSLCLAVFLGFVYLQTGQTSIQMLLQHPLHGTMAGLSTVFLILTAMSQSALWPFHRWLTSSLNSPTPVSALMHAGLVNGGGFLLARFAPIVLAHHSLLMMLFIVGVASALLGTLWKLMQSDIKRMLACSTMGQMGFMVAQCGLGLFPAAVAHLCFHGLFKAYLFLSSGSIAQEKRLDLGYPPALKHVMVALLYGMLGACLFSLCSGKVLFAANTTSFLTIITLFTCTQFALPMIRSGGIKNLLAALFMTTLLGAFYGSSIYVVEQVLRPLAISVPQPLNAIHLMALIGLCVAWLSILFAPRRRRDDVPEWRLRWYVRMLNASQPHPGSITTHRQQYQF